MRIKLRFKEIQEIRGRGGMGVIVLTDEEEQRALSIVCDALMTQQFRLRLFPGSKNTELLPEVLLLMLKCYDELDWELNIYDVSDGQYRVTLMNRNTLSLHTVRITDAVLLSHIAHVPIYIDERLMARQCSLYLKGGNALAIPINTISTEKLADALQQAIDSEDYRLASQIHKELESRNKQKDEGN